MYRKREGRQAAYSLRARADAHGGTRVDEPSPQTMHRDGTWAAAAAERVAKAWARERAAMQRTACEHAPMHMGGTIADWHESRPTRRSK